MGKWKSQEGGADVVLGVVTSIGGFVEAGSISTSAQAGAEFGFSLLWAILIATVCVAAITEMGGRLASVSRHTIASAVRERFGIRYQSIPIAGEVLLDFILLAAELGATAIALQLVTGLSPRITVIPIALLALALLWFGKFGPLEKGAGLAGLITLAFVVGAWKTQPSLKEVLHGFVPAVPALDRARYASLAVAILGATISPYLINFYSSGCVEESWKEKDLRANKAIAGLGMGFGSAVSMAVLVLAAMTIQGRKVETFGQAAQMMVPPFGRGGVPLFAAALAVGCFGTVIEISLALSYLLGQAFGWNWSKEVRPASSARFSLVFVVALLAAPVLIAAGLDTLKLTMLAMTITVLILPFVVFPLLVLMNDPHYVGEHHNHVLGNLVVVAVTGVGFLLALVVIPLQIFGGG